MTDIEVRRAAAGVLAAAARSLNDAIVRTEVSPGEVLAAAAGIAELAERLFVATRPLRTLPAIDVEGFSVRSYNPVSGQASPVAPPLSPDPPRLIE